MIKIKLKKLILFCNIISMFFAMPTYSQNINGEEIWMGWVSNEYRNMSYGAVANNNDDPKLKVEGYGRYQFKYNTNLVDFLKFADAEYFDRWIDYGSGSIKLNDYDYGLPQAFTDYYANNIDSFSKKQDKYVYQKYYKPIETAFDNAGINLSEKSSYLKGALFSAVMHRINNNEITQTISRSSLQDIVNLYDEDEKIYITKIYELMIRNYSDENSVKRFSKEKRACLEEHDDTFNSHVGEILNKKGLANSATFIRELNELNPTIFNEFLVNKKFSEKTVLDWYDAVRTSVNFKDEFGITSGALDFGTSTSHGINIDGYIDLIENEVVFQKPENDTGINYIPQNTTKATYSELKFGVNNIGQGGASLAVIAMAINKLKGISENLIFPDDLAKRITDKYNNVNYFYDEEKRGMKNEIINFLCNEYNLTSTSISKSSVANSILNGNLVIARVAESEFTKHGTFILICGVKERNGKKYVVIADPNIYHSRFLYNLYDMDYIANNCKGIFFEIKA